MVRVSKRSQNSTQKEPKDRYATSDSRPDIVVFDTGIGSNVELDIALAHPWSSDIFPMSATMERAATARRTGSWLAMRKKNILVGCL